MSAILKGFGCRPEHGLSEEELAAWERDVDRWGVFGLDDPDRAEGASELHRPRSTCPILIPIQICRSVPDGDEIGEGQACA
jgi:hypothetical protein